MIIWSTMQGQTTNNKSQSNKKGGVSSRLFKLLSRVERSSTAKKIAMSPLFLPIANALFGHSVNVKGDTKQSLIDAARLFSERPKIPADQPIFMFINLMGTHHPYDPPRWAMEKFTDDQVSFAKLKSELKALGVVLERPLPPSTKATLDNAYNAEIAAQDREIGIFFDRIKAANLWDDTLIIVVADHGEHLGEKQLLGHPYGAYADLIHVPLMIRDPQRHLLPGTQQERPISIRRIFHTILAFASNGKLPESKLTLAATLENDLDTPVFAEAWPRQRKLSTQEKSRVEKRDFHQEHIAVHCDSYKLIATPQQALGLYNIFHDPEEQQDLQDSLPKQVEGQYQQLRRFMQHPKAGVSANPNWNLDTPLLRQHLQELGYLERPNT